MKPTAASLDGHSITIRSAASPRSPSSCHHGLELVAFAGFGLRFNDPANILKYRFLLSLRLRDVLHRAHYVI